MKRMTLAWTWAVGIAAACGLWLGGGCEVVDEYNNVLSITPSSTNVTEASGVVLFSVAVNGVSNLTVGGSSTNSTTSGPPVILPIVWSVANPALGSIQAAAGLTAVYTRNGLAVGNNYVYARDSGRRYESVAVVSQTNPEEADEPGSGATNAPALTGPGSLVVSPAATVVTNVSATVTLTVVSETINAASGPVQLPFIWSVSSAGLGVIQVSGGRTAVYERNGAAVGNNFITVVDSSGRYEGTAVIEQR
ncbi:MAG: hypothetical protein FJ221_07525 [Lentisphaerae bacterium]|nr:hypothetical protein [Lentisphaerota bacterium]